VTVSKKEKAKEMELDRPEEHLEPLMRLEGKERKRQRRRRKRQLKAMRKERKKQVPPF
jgi:hypothetical protein